MTQTSLPDPPAAPRRARGRRMRLVDTVMVIVLGLVCLALYNANGRAISAADTFAARYLPFSILRNHTVLLDPILETVAQGRQAPPVYRKNSSAFWITHGLGTHYVSTYPVLLPVLIAPLYLPALAYLDAREWDPHLLDQVARVMEKLVASLIAACSVALLYLLLRRRSSVPVAAWLSVVYAFGTTTWVISSQALWAHGLAQLLIVATLLLLTGPRTALRVATAGLLCAMIAANRPADTVLAAALGIYALWWAGPVRLLFIATGLVPLALTVAYNLVAVGHVAGAYALFVRPHNYNDEVVAGIAGLLFSPTRGLFVFSPFLLFLPCLFGLAMRERATRGLTLALAAAVVVQVVFYAMVDWRQGISWGPRWLGDAMPMLMWMLAPVVAALSRPGRALFAATCVISVAIQAVGAFWYLGTVDAALVQANGRDRMQGMWRPPNAPFLAELRHPPAAADLMRAVRGNVDQIEVIDVVISGGERGDRIERQVDVAGWALVDSRSPSDVALLVDGLPVAGTAVFFTRQDVVDSERSSSPAGWHVRFALDALATGQHSLAALVRTDPGAEPRLLRTRFFEIPTASPAHQRKLLLARASELAVKRLAAHQQPPGYWLTAFTSGPRYEHPQAEMNIYVNAVMLDIAGPAASSLAPLDEALVRARGFLTRQIEDDGLVRYHGRPDAATIGVLGCAITPDSDDTTLVWRVAPAPDRALLARAIKVVHQYRRPDGLYRTWLAERARFQCLDPGRDPNPADLVIQMHILMLLAQEDPPAAAALCRALTARVSDDNLWVYYAGAPPMAILRLADMDKAGCPLQLPPSRMRSETPGQEPWVQAAQLLWQVQSRAPAPALYAAAATLLQDLAASDFRLVVTTPPLLYHNDFTATVRRYYWSEDLGYAMWLRLYHERERIGRTLGCQADDAAPECGNR